MDIRVKTVIEMADWLEKQNYSIQVTEVFAGAKCNDTEIIKL